MLPPWPGPDQLHRETVRLHLLVPLCSVSIRSLTYLGACRTSPTTHFSTDALPSAQIPVTAMDPGGKMCYAQAQNLPSLEPGADVAAAALADGVAAGKPSGVFPARPGRRAGSLGDLCGLRGEGSARGQGL